MLTFITLRKFDTDRYNDNEDGEGVRSFPCRINPATIRCFYARRNNAPGSRITFADGGGFVVVESPTEIEQALIGAGVPVHC